MGEAEVICLIIYAVIFAAFMAAKRKASAEDEEEIEPENPIQIAHIQHDNILWELSDGEHYFSKDEVTHWMPLPEPPERE